MVDTLRVMGTLVHNLKNIRVDIPKIFAIFNLSCFL